MGSSSTSLNNMFQEHGDPDNRTTAVSSHVTCCVGADVEPNTKRTGDVTADLDGPPYVLFDPLSRTGLLSPSIIDTSHPVRVCPALVYESPSTHSSIPSPSRVDTTGKAAPETSLDFSTVQDRPAEDGVVHNFEEVLSSKGTPLNQLKTEACRAEAGSSWVGGETESLPPSTTASTDNGYSSNKDAELDKGRNEHTESDFQSVDLLPDDSGYRSVHATTEAEHRCSEGADTRVCLPESGAQGEFLDPLSTRNRETPVDDKGTASECDSESQLAVASHAFLRASDGVSDLTYKPAARDAALTIEVNSEIRPMWRTVPILDGNTVDSPQVGEAAAVSVRKLKRKHASTFAIPFLSCCGEKERQNTACGLEDRSSGNNHCCTKLSSDDTEILLSERGGRWSSGCSASHKNVLVAPPASVAFGEVEADSLRTGTSQAVHHSPCHPDSPVAVSSLTLLPTQDDPHSSQLRIPETNETSQTKAQTQTSLDAPEHQTCPRWRHKDSTFAGYLNFLAWCSQPCGFNSGPDGTEFVPGPPRLHRRRQPRSFVAQEIDNSEPFAAVFFRGALCSSLGDASRVDTEFAQASHRPTKTWPHHKKARSHHRETYLESRCYVDLPEGPEKKSKSVDIGEARGANVRGDMAMENPLSYVSVDLDFLNGWVRPTGERASLRNGGDSDGEQTANRKNAPSNFPESDCRE
ncbi:UNVERIFIED_CONTAM: hypothetical protein HHA_228065 [Hammondia hammondi]|eukprot:XP_008882151.1 hypothetical protein HHA_228065 [Hammondia hammondi]